MLGHVPASPSWPHPRHICVMCWLGLIPSSLRAAPCPGPVQDGAAFLLERRGDMHGALRIHIQALDQANKDLVAAVRSGRLDLSAAAAAAVAAAADAAYGGAATGRPPAASVVLLRPRRLTAGRAGSSAAASAAMALLDSELVPPELQAARDALAAAIAMCLRQARIGESMFWGMDGW